MGTQNTGAQYATTHSSPLGEWTNSANILVEDGSTAATNTDGHRQDTATFGFSIPSDVVITGILLEAKLHTVLVGKGSCFYTITASWDGGTSYTSAFGTAAGTKPVWESTGGEFTLPGNREWVPSELSDANFRLRVTRDSSSGVVSLHCDAVRATGYYRARNASGEGGALKTARQVIMG